MRSGGRHIRALIDAPATVFETPGIASFRDGPWRLGEQAGAVAGLQRALTPRLSLHESEVPDQTESSA